MKARIHKSEVIPSQGLFGEKGVRARFQSDLIAYDTEGTGLIPYGPPRYWGYYPARAFAHSFCDAEGNDAWIRGPVDPTTRRVLSLPRAEETALRYVLGTQRFTKIGHNIAYDKRITEAAGYVWHGEIHDTMVMAHVVTAGDELSYALKPLCKKYLDFPDDDERVLEDAVKLARTDAKHRGWMIAGGKKEVERGDNVVFAGDKPVKADYWLVPTPAAVTDTPGDLVREYGVGDAQRAMLMFLFFWPMLESDRRLMATYRREMALFATLRRMEHRATRIYPSQTDHLIAWYLKDMDRQRAIADASGGFILNNKGESVRMNFNSPPQLMKKFYVERGYPMEYKERKNKKTGEQKLTPTFGKDQLAVYGAVDDETGEPKDVLAKAILEYRAAKQTISGFLNIYKKFWYPEGPIRPNHQGYFDKIMSAPTGRLTIRERAWIHEHCVWVLHPNYNQTGAVTGRMTCGTPNLQQVASATTGLRKSDIAQRPRECFGPRPGCLWYLPDYCLHPDTLVWTIHGHKKIQDIRPGERVYAFDDKAQKITWGRVTRVSPIRPLPAYRLTFDNGESVIASDDHKWPVQDGPWDERFTLQKKTKDLVIGERMVPIRRFDGHRPWFTSMQGTKQHSMEQTIVAEAFHGPRPLGYDIHHRDEDPTNNHPDNLEYRSAHVHRSEHSRRNYRKQNHTLRVERLREALKHRRSYDGTRNPNNKLSEKDLTAILGLADSGLSHQKIGDRFGVSQTHVSRIVKHQGTGFNHRLIKKEFIGPQPMWAITVEDHHNFALSCGVITSNSQIEVWLFAFMSGETGMKNLLMSGYDFHQGVAEKSFTSKRDYVERKKYYRKLAKLIMFGKLYGGGVGTPDNPGRMTRLLQMPFHEAKAFIDSFEEQFASVKIYMRDLQNEAKRNGEAWNLYGRKYVMQRDWAYKVVNYMIQGTAADMLKMATLRVDWMLETRWAHPGLGLINSIHDELMIEVPLAVHGRQLQREIAWVMQMDSALCGIPVPVPVGLKATKPLYVVREHRRMQRWSDTRDLKIRTNAEFQHWLKRGNVGGRMDPTHDDIDKFMSTVGGVPYLPHEIEGFADLAAHMDTCPYNKLILTDEEPKS